jgi:hypothetical protein
MNAKIDNITVRQILDSSPRKWRVCVETARGRAYHATWADDVAPTKEEVAGSFRNGSRKDWI